MKKIIKHYWLFIIASICILFAIPYVLSSDYLNGINDINEKEYESCMDYVNTGTYTNKNNYTDEQLYFKPWESCAKTVEYEEVTYSTFYIFNNSMLELGILFPVFLVILMIFPIIYENSKKFKNRQIKPILLREDYKIFVKKIFKDAYKNIWPVLVAFIIIFLVSYIISGHFYVLYEKDNYLIDYDIEMIKQPLMYIVFLLTVFVNMGIYINIGLIVQSKNKNFIITLIESVTVVLVLWFGIEAIGGLLQKANILPESYFYAVDVFRINHYFNLNLYLSFGIYFVVFLITFVMAVVSYKSKEKLIHMCEK